ncbi:hypothetical protein BD324DRAFT_624649 [Kockovaella imperatae]|uniref:THIF-type NAD/FAD binding fold domain-containing protein n=1 Tax=Kockovaella imperatae TaxID=4999 RepID=A0A1Y1UG90_9TREE|nr:hypothetical protein BD324DRAFT_624649 [Kockovaella imperatae]ORX37063.1 hypothetical protein BD324DRAFT_624649 [Kockovaella imperatae]
MTANGEHTAGMEDEPRGSGSAQHITEDEASLYDRQIRLWGLEAQNRMRSSTVLLLSLRSLAHETIKNLVLAGIGRLIVMDDGAVTVDDLGTGFLFREEEGAVGQERVRAAAAQIESLNPLVSLTVRPTLSPFVRDPSTASSSVDTEREMVDFLRKERVDVVVACDLKRDQLIAIDGAARKAGSMFYGAGSYGFYGYVFADLGADYEYVYSPLSTSTNPSPSLFKKKLSFPSFSQALETSNWYLGHKSTTLGASPFRDLTRQATRDSDPLTVIAMLALWEYEKRFGSLPSSSSRKRRRAIRDEGEQRSGTSHDADEAPSDDPPHIDDHEGVTASDSHEAFNQIYSDFKSQLGLNPKFRAPGDQHGLDMESIMLSHLVTHAEHSFAPTLAILGGLLAQDVLRALSKKDKPFVNLLAVDSMGGTGAVSRWAMLDAVDA